MVIVWDMTQCSFLIGVRYPSVLRGRGLWVLPSRAVVLEQHTIRETGCPKGNCCEPEVVLALGLYALNMEETMRRSHDAGNYCGGTRSTKRLTSSTIGLYRGLDSSRIPSSSLSFPPLLLLLLMRWGLCVFCAQEDAKYC